MEIKSSKITKKEIKIPKNIAFRRQIMEMSKLYDLKSISNENPITLELDIEYPVKKSLPLSLKIILISQTKIQIGILNDLPQKIKM
jgi:hypothetical protein